MLSGITPVYSTWRTLPRDWMPLDSTSSTTTQPTKLASTRCSCSSPGSAILADLFSVRSLQHPVSCAYTSDVFNFRSLQHPVSCAYTSDLFNVRSLQHPMSCPQAILVQRPFTATLDVMCPSQICSTSVHCNTQCHVPKRDLFNVHSLQHPKSCAYTPDSFNVRAHQHPVSCATYT